MTPFDLRNWPNFSLSCEEQVRDPVVDQVVIDSRRVASSRALFVALEGHFYDGHQFVEEAAAAGARFALVRKNFRPSLSMKNCSLLRVENPLKALQELAGTYRRRLTTTVIAITGSVGKTMLKDLLHTLLKAKFSLSASPESFNSQIGVPLSLFKIRDSDELAIIEAGISKKGEMDTLASMIAPNHAIITRIGEAHLETLKDRSTIIQEKLKLAYAVPSPGLALLPQELLSYLERQPLKGNVVYWDAEATTLPFCAKDAKCPGTFQLHFPDGALLKGKWHLEFLPLFELTHIAARFAWLLGMPSEAIIEQIKSYFPEPMKTEAWRSPSGVTLLNSAYCADPQSLEKALRHFEHSETATHKFLLFGGIKGKSGKEEIQSLSYSILKHKIKTLYLYGDHGIKALIPSLREAGIEVADFLNSTAALEKIKEVATHGDHVLVKGKEKQPLEQLMEVLSGSLPHNVCSIHLEAIAHNLNVFRERIGPQTRVMVMVKALGYGTDDIRMGHFLASCGIEILGVSHVEEGVALKKAGLRQEIFVLNAAPYEVQKVVKWQLEVGVQQASMIQALSEEASLQKQLVKVHLHVDTGMGRLGCRPEEALNLALLIQKSPYLEFEGLMSHFSSAEEPAHDAFTFSQFHSLEKVRIQLQEQGLRIKHFHIANSAAVLRFPQFQGTMVRLGLGLFGLHACSTLREIAPLKPSLSLTSHIVGFNQLQKGDSVSYGRHYRALLSHERHAVLPLGYFDGLNRHYSGKGTVLIHGQRAPLVGNICMDYLMCDVTHIPEARLGDPVLIFGKDGEGNSLPLEEFAQTGGSIAHELIARLGPRIQRVFLYEF